MDLKDTMYDGRGLPVRPGHVVDGDVSDLVGRRGAREKEQVTALEAWFHASRENYHDRRLRIGGKRQCLPHAERRGEHAEDGQALHEQGPQPYPPQRRQLRSKHPAKVEVVEPRGGGYGHHQWREQRGATSHVGAK